MLRAMSSSELSEWMAFARLEPFGAQVDDFRFAQLQALMANIWSNDKSKTYVPLDFMPDYDESIAEARDRQTVDKLLDFKRSFEAKVKTSREVRQEAVESPL